MKRLLIIAILFLLAGPGWGTDFFFGGDTINATTAVQSGDSTYWADTITTPANTGTLDSAIGWFDWNIGGPDSMKFVIYNNDSTFLDSTAKFAITSGTRTRYSAPFIVGAAISASTRYFVTLHFSSTGTGSTARFYYYSTGAVLSSWYKSAQAATPATITAPTKDTNNRKKAIGIYYSDAAAAVTKKIGAAKLGAGKW